MKPIIVNKITVFLELYKLAFGNNSSQDNDNIIPAITEYKRSKNIFTFNLTRNIEAIIAPINSEIPEIKV